MQDRIGSTFPLNIHDLNISFITEKGFEAHTHLLPFLLHFQNILVCRYQSTASSLRWHAGCTLSCGRSKRYCMRVCSSRAAPAPSSLHGTSSSCCIIIWSTVGRRFKKKSCLLTLLLCKRDLPVLNSAIQRGLCGVLYSYAVVCEDHTDTHHRHTVDLLLKTFTHNPGWLRKYSQKKNRKRKQNFRFEAVAVAREANTQPAL